MSDELYCKDCGKWGDHLPDTSECPNRKIPDQFVKVVLAELERATSKFPTWPTDPLHALAVLGEEFGELTQAVLQATYDGGPTRHVRTEAVQTAAMALRFLMSLDRYEYVAREQHSQNSGNQRQI